MKRLLIATALGAVFAVSAAALAWSHPKITEKVIAAGGVAQPYTIDVAKPADVIVAKATVPAGASFGWHSPRRRRRRRAIGHADALRQRRRPVHAAARPGRTRLRRAAQPRPPRPQRDAPHRHGPRHLPRPRARRRSRRAGIAAGQLPLLRAEPRAGAARPFRVGTPDGGTQRAQPSHGRADRGRAGAVPVLVRYRR